MNISCSAEPCPVILDCSCVFYSGANLIYTGIVTNDTLCAALIKIDNKFKDAAIGYVFENGIVQAVPGGPVRLGGTLTQNTVITSGPYTFALTGTIESSAFITTGGTSTQFVKGDGSLDSTAYQPAGNYITGLTGDGTANGPGSAVFTLANVNPTFGTWGSATQVPIITTDSKGRITNITTTLITIPSSSLSFFGDVSGFGNTGSPVQLTLNTVLATPGVYGSSTTVPVITVNGKGLITSITQVPVSGGGGGGGVTSVSVTAGTGISASVANPTTTPNITITNTAPDQTVVLNNGAGINVTGTYPNFTIAATGTGGVTSVTASLPISSSGGATPNISITQASGSTDGYLSSGDWTIFNNKVGGSGTTNYVPKFSNTGTPATIADSQIFDNGTSVGIGTITPSASFKLDVVGNIRASQFGYFGNNEVRINTSTSGYMELYDSTEKKFIVGNGATDVASFRTYNGNIFQFDNNADFIPLQLARFSSQVFKSVGTDTHNVIQSSPIINATGGTTLVRGFYYDPNLTSTTGVTNVAFENANGDIIHRNLATGGADEMVTVDSVGKLKKQAISTGGVTSVSATSPITSSGGTTPDISTSMATNKLIGRSTAGVGVMEEITIGAGLSLSAGTLSSTAEGILHGTASGTDTYTVTIAGATAYADGDAYLIRFPNGNTGTATLNISGFGAVGLYRNNDGPVIGGDIWNGSEMLCIYNSTTAGFQLIGTSPNAMYAYVTNDDSVTITKGQVVYAFGGQGDRMTVKLANNVGDATSAQTVGVVLSTSIAANQKGVIITQGLLDGLSILPTATYADGDPLYLGSTAGSITNVKPYAPNHLVYLGNVTTASNGSAGRWYVRVQNGYELDELHNVQAQSPTVNDVLYYFGGSPGQWKTASISTVLGYTPVGGTGTTNELAYFTGASTIGSLTTATYPSLTELSYVKGVTSSIQTQIGTKITDNAWVDYSATSTITGWSAYTTKKLQYKALGTNTLLVQFQIEGTGTGTTASFTIPSAATAWGVQYGTHHNLNNTTQTIGVCSIQAGGVTVSFNPTASTASAWTNATARQIHGQIIINIA